MPAPIIAGAAVAGGRVVGGSVKTTGRIAARGNRTIRDRREERQTAAQPAARRQRTSLRQRLLKKPGSLAGKATDAAFRALHMVRVTMVHISLALPLLTLYVVQLVGFVIYAFVDQLLEYIIVRAVDTVIIDLDWIWMVGWGIGTLAGLASVALLMVGYSTALINWLKLWSIVALILTITLYFAPYLLAIPWVLLWMTVVFWSR